MTLSFLVPCFSSVFNTQLKAQDTICLYLYKRVFPKWKAELYHGQDISEANEDADEDQEDDENGADLSGDDEGMDGDDQ